MTELCIVLKEKTLKANLALLAKHEKEVSMAELRADCLTEDDRFDIRGFPEKSGVPVSLSIKRKADGGEFTEGEGARTLVFARGLAFPELDKKKNFASIYMEEDFRVPGIEDAARTFGTTIIRGIEGRGVPGDLAARVRRIQERDGEIPCISVAPRSTHEQNRLLAALESMAGEVVLACPGPYGLPFRILSDRYGSPFVYVASSEYADAWPEEAYLRIEDALGMYRIGKKSAATAIFGIIGDPLMATQSPALHNAGYAKLGMDAVYIPFRCDHAADFMEIAETLPVRGFSVTVPHKEAILASLDARGEEVEEIGACNTVIRGPSGWEGRNTDEGGFGESLLEFLGRQHLKGVRATVIGAGGSAQAVAYALNRLGATMLILNRTPSRARLLARRYDARWGATDLAGAELALGYNDLIVQTSSAGMVPYDKEDPLPYYEFTGKEAVVDIVYKPAETIFLKRAKVAGCATTNGFGMLKAQAKRQFELFTNRGYPLDA
jgi:3-dehydroquinate dehydratase/shikimate dehydrogenase